MRVGGRGVSPLLTFTPDNFRRVPSEDNLRSDSVKIASDNVKMPADIIPFKLYSFASHARCAVQFRDARACIKRGDVLQRHHLNGAKA